MDLLRQRQQFIIFEKDLKRFETKLMATKIIIVCNPEKCLEHNKVINISKHKYLKFNSNKEKIQNPKHSNNKPMKYRKSHR